MTHHKLFLILILQGQHSGQLLHQKPKTKKGHWQTNGHCYLQGKSEEKGKGQLLCLTGVHFTLYQSRMGYLHRHSQPASILVKYIKLWGIMEICVLQNFCLQ